MSNKISFKSKILNILTFGYIKRKAKEISQETNSEIKISKNVNLNVQELINFLGGPKNIVDVSATLTTLKVTFLKKEIISNDKIKDIGARGIIMGENYISMVFGDWSKELANEILDLLKRKKNV